MSNYLCVLRKTLQILLAGWLLTVSAVVHTHDLFLNPAHSTSPAVSAGATANALGMSGVCLACLISRNLFYVSPPMTPAPFRQQQLLPLPAHRSQFVWLRVSHLNDRAPPAFIA